MAYTRANCRLHTYSSIAVAVQEQNRRIVRDESIRLQVIPFKIKESLNRIVPNHRYDIRNEKNDEHDPCVLKSSVQVG